MTTKPLQLLRRDSRWPWMLAALAFLACLGVTSWLVWRTERASEREAQARFARERDLVVEHVRGAMDRHEQSLYGMRGLFIASREVEQAEWKSFVSGMQTRPLPGVIGFGFTRRVPAGGLEAFVARRRKNGAPEFAVHGPDGKPPSAAQAAEELAVVEYVEPLETNRSALGIFNPAGTPRFEALEASARSGLPAATAPLQLAQSAHNSPGILLFCPVYAAGRPLDTPEQRLVAVDGWVYLAIELEPLFRAAGGGMAGDMLDCEVFDGVTGRQVFDADGHLAAQGRGPFSQALDPQAYLGRRYINEARVMIQGREWRMVLSSSPRFEGDLDRLPVWVLGAAGLALSVLSGAAMYLLLSNRRQALRAAHQLADDLRAQGAELARARDAAETGSRAKSAFLAGVSHELRTPMNAVIGMAELMDRGELPPGQREHLRVLMSSAFSLLGLLNDLLDLNQIEAGRMEVRPQPLALPDLLAEVLQLHAPEAMRRGLALSLELAPGLPDGVRSDPQRLRQILHNLVGNALKFTDQGRVRVHAAAVPGRGGRGELELRVEDTGMGIDADTRRRLFEPFEQGDANRRLGGNGLGLAITRRLVRLLGGDIRVQSEPGVGSRFVVHLPLEQAPVPAPPPAPPAGAGPVWLVLPPGAERDYLVRALEAAGWPVVLADDAAAAQRLWGVLQPRPQVVVLDMDLHDLAPLLALLQVEGGPRLVPLLRAPAPVPGPAAQWSHPLARPVAPGSLLVLLAEAAGVWTAQARPAAPVAARRVLLVEDNLVNQKVARGLLEQRGHQVEVVADGVSAIERMVRPGLDCVLMDIQMPGMDGLETVRRFRAIERPGQRLRIVALSANAFPEDRAAALAAGMDGFCAKPVEASALFAVVEAVAAANK